MSKNKRTKTLFASVYFYSHIVTVGLHPRLLYDTPTGFGFRKESEIEGHLLGCSTQSE